METKNKLRKKFLKLRKKKYFHVDSNKFTQLISYIKKKFTKKKKYSFTFVLSSKL